MSDDMQATQAAKETGTDILTSGYFPPPSTSPSQALSAVASAEAELVFDKNWVLDAGKSGYMQMSTAAKEAGTDVAHERLFSPTINITEPGYVYIYLSNEETTPVDVFFDDLKVTQVKTPIVQVEDYYPFGLTFNSYQRDSSMPDQYLYNGKELQDELSLGWLDYGVRGYDPSTANWHSIDIFSDAYSSYSPYAYVLGNPISNRDVKGMWTVSRHSKSTLEALLRVGIGGQQAELIAHYASVYADNPGMNILLNNYIHTEHPVFYMEGIDYKPTINSQLGPWSPGAGTNYNIWHSMRSPEEDEAYLSGNGGISAEKARMRGMEFGWNEIFSAAESKTKLKDLKKNTAEIQSLGQGLHALQDSYAHKGRSDVSPGHLWRDWADSRSSANAITAAAITVYKLLTNDFDGIRTNKRGGLSLTVTGMSSEQKSKLLEKAVEFLNSRDKKK